MSKRNLTARGQMTGVIRKGRRGQVTMVFLGGAIMGMFCLAGLAAPEMGSYLFSQKGTPLMQPAAKSLLPEKPPLDLALPAQTETFTFGLG